MLHDSVCQTKVSMMIFFSFFIYEILFYFILGERLQGQSADVMGQGDECYQDAQCERRKE